MLVASDLSCLVFMKNTDSMLRVDQTSFMGRKPVSVGMQCTI